MKLSHLTDKSLLSEIKNLVAQERGQTLKLLHHLKEVDLRKLYADLKCSSLFDYCTRELGYSEGSAQRRIVACRMLRDLPEIEAKIESGKLTLSNLSQVNSMFKDRNVQKKMLPEIEGISKKACEKKLFELSGLKRLETESKKRLSHDKVQVAIILNDETITLMEEVKALLNGQQSSDELLQFAFRAAKEKILKEKFKQTASKTSPPPVKVGRYIQAYVKREIYRRDQKCTCCGSQRNLNFDHIKPFSLGGTSGIENIRLLCESCNQRARIRARL